MDILSPFWSGNVSFRESFLPLENMDGSIDDIDLLFPISEVLEVLSSSFKTVYVEGIDYYIVDGRLRIPAKSRIPRIKFKDYYPLEPMEGHSFPKVGGGNVRYEEGAFFHDLQTVITYRHSKEWSGYIPENKSDLLRRTKEILSVADPLRIVFFGDSISVGCNASSLINVEPYQQIWCDLVSDKLKEETGSMITKINTSVGGTGSAWAAETADERVASMNPDLAVLGFGMNDGGLEPEKFITNIQKIVTSVRVKNENCEFILISTMLPNEKAKGFFINQVNYEHALLQLEENGIAVCNMTEVHSALLKRKKYRDMTGNNVNHTNDYLSRVYAQAVLATLGY